MRHTPSATEASDAASATAAAAWKPMKRRLASLAMRSMC